MLYYNIIKKQIIFINLYFSKLSLFLNLCWWNTTRNLHIVLKICQQRCNKEENVTIILPFSKLLDDFLTCLRSIFVCTFYIDMDNSYTNTCKVLYTFSSNLNYFYLVHHENKKSLRKTNPLIKASVLNIFHLYPQCPQITKMTIMRFLKVLPTRTKAKMRKNWKYILGFRRKINDNWLI